MSYGSWKSQDDEKRLLRIKVPQLQRALQTQRQRREEAEDKVKELERELGERLKRIEELEKENEELRRQRDSYRDKLFKRNKSRGEEKEGEAGSPNPGECKSRVRRRGGQKGHMGKSRQRPGHVDEVVRVYLDHCPDCGSNLERGNQVTTHTVEDIPPLEKVHSRVVKYESECQWCPGCKKRVRGCAEGVIPRSRLGVNVFLYILIHRYMCRNSWEIIVRCLETFYGLKISVGTAVDMMHRGRRWFTPRYKELLELIRQSPVKHADETSWRVEGQNQWVWGFFTQQQCYYAIHDSRGKGIPLEALAGSHPDDVLVRDDYGGYAKLPLNHQSCWAHLLRKSHEAAEAIKASPQVIELHEQLKTMYETIKQINDSPFDIENRKQHHQTFTDQLQAIINTGFEAEDAKKIQTRIANQNTNLLTALLFENVPLTNNRAEQALRPIVVTRKISGGSRSQQGAHTHAVHMSILQSNLAHKIPLIQQYKNIIDNLCNRTE